MQIFFHIGPHKTGTSSIQFLLRQRYGSDTPQPIWYPVRNFTGGTAGQNRIANCFRPMAHLYDPAEGLRQLEEVVKDAQASNVERLLISAENFSFASAADMQSIRAKFPDENFHLIITATPLTKRFVSQWSTQLLNGNQSRIEQIGEFLPMWPGFRTDYYSSAVAAFHPCKAILISIEKIAQPDFLLQSYFQVCGLSADALTERELTPKNISLDYFQSELLIRFNELYADSAQVQPSKLNDPIPVFKQQEYVDLRSQLVKVFRHPAWMAAMASRKLAFPESMRPTLQEIGSAQRTDIDNLTATGRLAVVGDVDALFADLALTPLN